MRTRAASASRSGCTIARSRFVLRALPSGARVDPDAVAALLGPAERVAVLEERIRRELLAEAPEPGARASGHGRRLHARSCRPAGAVPDVAGRVARARRPRHAPARDPRGGQRAVRRPHARGRGPGSGRPLRLRADRRPGLRSQPRHAGGDRRLPGLLRRRRGRRSGMAGGFRRRVGRASRRGRGHGSRPAARARHPRAGGVRASGRLPSGVPPHPIRAHAARAIRSIPAVPASSAQAAT